MNARAPIRTLLIEDVPSDAHTLTGYLSSGGWRPFSVKVVHTVEDALRAMQAELFDAAILDLSLSEPTEVGALGRLRNAAPHLAVVVLTGPGNESLGPRAIAAGAADYLPKHEVGAAALCRAVYNAVERHRIVWHLREVIARAPDAMVVVDRLGKVQLVNRAAMAMLRGEAEALLGQGLGVELRAGLVRELRLPAPDAGEADAGRPDEPRLAELRVGEVTWNGQPAHLCCLREIGRYAKLARELKAENDRLQGLVEPESGPQVLTRRGLERALANELERLRRSGTHLAAVLVFCDEHRDFSDAHDKEVILTAAARAIAEITRPCDHVGRITDDSFLLLLSDTRLAEAVVVAEKLRAGLARKTVQLAGQARPIVVSVGVAAAPHATTTLRELFGLCKDALLAGRPDVNSLMWNATPVPVSPEQARAGGLPDGPIRVVQQPIVRLDSEGPLGSEFLIRGPKGPLENPAALAGASVDVAALVQLDVLCLRACVEAARARPAGWRCHFNLFPATLDNLPAEELALILRGVGSGPVVCVEISEQHLVGDPSRIAARLRPLREAGIEIAIDDLGFGRSSLEVLLVIEPRVVKIDRRYVVGVSADREQARLLRRFVALVTGAGALAIAEGIDSPADLELVRDMGVAYAQGALWPA